MPASRAGNARQQKERGFPSPMLRKLEPERNPHGGSHGKRRHHDADTRRAPFRRHDVADDGHDHRGGQSPEGTAQRTRREQSSGTLG